MSSKHTPGPRGIEQTDDTNWIGFMRPDGKKVELIVCTTSRDNFFKPETQERNDANARLIAAAPELLEALTKKVQDAEQRMFEDWLEFNSPSGDHEAIQRQWLESNDYRGYIGEWREQLDAIAKATGGAQ